MTVVLASAVDVTVVLALALAAAAALRRRSAALRHAVLAAGVVAAGLTPALELLLPQLPLIQSGGAPTTAVVSDVTMTSADAPAQSIVDTGDEPSAFSWSAALATIWIAGAAIALTGLLTGFARLSRLTAHCTVVRAGPWRDTADDLSRIGALRRPVTLLQSASPSLLVTYGVLKPTIILPAGAALWSADRRRIVLAHELAHVRRCDAALQLGAEAIRVIHWFNPFVWISCRQLRQESEHACDDAVLHDGTAATEYAAHLLGIARHAAGRQPAWVSAHAIAHPSTLERRIAAVLNGQRNREPLTRPMWAGVLFAVAAVIVPLAAAGVAPVPRSPAGIVADARDATLLPEPLKLEAAPVPPVRRPTPAARAFGAAEQVTAVAQPVDANFSGMAVDQTGAALPGAGVTLSDINTRDRYVTVTDDNGRFVFRSLEPAEYELSASLSGFATVSRAVTIAAPTTMERMILTLPLGTLEQTVVVGCPATPLVAAAPLTHQVATHAHTTYRGALSHWRMWNRIVSAIHPVLSAQAGVPVRVGGAVRVPKRIATTNPVCPQAPIPETGTIVRVFGRIGKDGAIHDVTRIASGTAPPAEFTASALDAVRQWTFTPPLLNGQPVEVSMMVQVIYRRM